MGRTKLKSWAMMTAAWMALGVPAAAYLSPQAAAAKSASTKADAPPPVAQVRYFRIAPQDLVAALNEFGRQSGRDILFSTEVAKQKRSTAVDGPMTAEQALRTLLSNTGLTFRATSEHTFLVELAQAAPQDPGVQATQSAEESEEAEKPAEDERKVERVVVTGTHIRGKHPKSSPLDTYTRKDIERSGATTTEQFIQKLPQNSGTRTSYATGSLINPDRTAVSGVDLRGLGVGTTLVLLNGRRIASSDRGQMVDVSLIPAVAIERIEVLTDGASAIYGSDAIGGVVNFVLRSDFDGAETRGSYGGVTSGNLRQGDFTQTLGHSWGSGHGLISYNFFSASALEVSDRDYAASQERGLLTPQDQRHNLLASFSQEIGDRLLISGDLGYSSRDVKSAFAVVTSTNLNNHQLTTSRSETEQVFVGLSLDYEILSDLAAHVGAVYSDSQTDSRRHVEFYKRSTPTATLSTFTQQPSLIDVTASIDGSLFALPGGDARFALGLGLLTEEYSGEAFSLATARGTLGRDTTYAYSELFLPIVGPDQKIPLVNQLELSLAARYTDYADNSRPALDREFGDSTDPKIGVVWAPISSLDLRATYGTSFRAPSLIQIDEGQALNTLQNTFSIPFPSGPTATALQIINLAVPDLGPESAETYTLGFDFRLESHPGFRLSGTYYSISYDDRIASPPLDGAAYVQFPDIYSHITYRAPSAAFIEDILRNSTNVQNQPGIDLSDPHQAAVQLFALPNFWIIDRRTRNLSLSQQDGFDLTMEDRFETPIGEVSLGGTLTRILSYRQQAAPTSAVVNVVDTVTQPVDLRGRVFAGLSSGAFDGTLSVNYVDDYTNPFTVPAQPVRSWTTTDLNLSYDFGAESDPNIGIRVNLSIQNLFDEDPPLVRRSAPGQQAGVQGFSGFDPANANPLGRFIVLSLSKQW